MATTTVAAGRIRDRANEGPPCPPGWLLTREGRPSTDPLEAADRGGTLTPLGGSHKGYGLAAMVDILNACLSGSTPITDPMRMRRPHGQDIGHFLLALAPGLFRDEADFRADVSAFCDVLQATPPVDPAAPVMVASDPERAHARRRLREGIPVAPGPRAKVRAIAREGGAPWLLGDA